MSFSQLYNFLFKDFFINLLGLFLGHLHFLSYYKWSHLLSPFNLLLVIRNKLAIDFIFIHLAELTN
jgi:hypothetical protein